MVLPYLYRLLVNFPGGDGYCTSSHGTVEHRYYIACIALTIFFNLLYVCAVAMGQSLDANSQSEDEKASPLCYWLPPLAAAAIFAGAYIVLASSEIELWLPVPCSAMLRAIASRLDWEDSLCVKAFVFDLSLVVFGIGVKAYGARAQTAEEENMLLEKERPSSLSADSDGLDRFASQANFERCKKHFKVSRRAGVRGVGVRGSEGSPVAWRLRLSWAVVYRQHNCGT